MSVEGERVCQVVFNCDVRRAAGALSCPISCVIATLASLSLVGDGKANEELLSQ